MKAPLFLLYFSLSLPLTLSPTICLSLFVCDSCSMPLSVCMSFSVNLCFEVSIVCDRYAQFCSNFLSSYSYLREGHLSVAQLLLSHHAKVNVPSGSENNIPLTLACWKGSHLTFIFTRTPLFIPTCKVATGDLHLLFVCCHGMKYFL